MRTTSEHAIAAPPGDRVLVGSGGGSPAPTHRPRRRRLLVIVIVVVLAGVAYGVAAKPFSASVVPARGVADNADATSTVTVTQRDLSQQTQVSATLGYAGSYTVVNQAQGTVTWLPALGQVVSEGQPVYDVDGSPVVLLYGATPAYRTLAEGASATDVTGADVRDLNYDLIALGYVTGAELGSEANDFGYWTKVGVEKLQATLGVAQNGILALGQYVFLPSASRITALGTNTVIGGQAQPGSEILSATSTGRIVTIALDAGQQAEVAVGDAVTITLPDSQTTPGTVTSVGTVATTSSAAGGGSSPPTITVLVTPTDPATTGNLDQAPVEVSITTASVHHVMVVPVDALLALTTGGYGLEVVSPSGVHSLEPVTLGLFDDADGLVQVTGAGVTAGQRVVIPATST
jgi:hypothetical protein